jgi:hypothetical protein
METQGNEPSAQGESQEAGLLDSAVVADDSQGQQVDPSTTKIDHLTKQDDDEPLERPDWWPENFWKKDEAAPDLEAIAKSWQDLRKQISQGKHKAPPDGKYDTTVFGDTPEDDPLRQHVQNWAKEYGISQSAFDKLVGDYMAMAGDQQQEVRSSIEQERKALGPNADAMIKGAVDWASGLVRKGIFSQDDFDEFKYAAGTAKGLKMMLKLRESYENIKIPTQSAPVEGAASKDELYQMVADPRYQTDPAFRTKVEKMFQQHFS